MISRRKNTKYTVTTLTKDMTPLTKNAHNMTTMKQGNVAYQMIQCSLTLSLKHSHTFP